MLSLKIPALSNKSISCQLENSEYWDCDINVKMDFGSEATLGVGSSL